VYLSAIARVTEAIGHESGDAFAQRTQAWADALGQAATNAASATNGIVLLSAEQVRAPTPQPTKAAPGISVVVNNPTFLSGSPKELREFARSIKKELDAIKALS
jgi:hypothetical protein